MEKSKGIVIHDKGLVYIAIWKFVKGIILLMFGISSLFYIKLNYINNIVLDIQEELMIEHLSYIKWILNKILTFLEKGNLQTTGILALVYSIVLITEGIGVYLQKKWAEYLILLSTFSLVQFEFYHLILNPTIIKVCIIVINILVVIYLYRLLKKKTNS